MHRGYLLFFVVFSFLINFTIFGTTHAQSSFEDYHSNPVFSYSGVSGTFDQMRVFSHDVVKVNGEYWMYYSGVPNGNSVQIGLATSADGINWQRHPNNPVFRCRENTGSCGSGTVWSSFRVAVVSVEYIGSEFKMWYWGSNQSDPFPKLGYATSNDGVNWHPYEINPVFGFE